MTKTTAALVASTLLFAPLALSQTTKPDPLVEKVEVSVVNVDTVVTDRKGNPVSGLTVNDFQLFEDGKPQKITGFYTIQDGTVKLPGGTADRDRQDQFRRKVVLMVDNNSVDKIQRDRALTRLDDFIDNQFGQDYEWSVISVGRSVDTIQPFTEQKGEIREALVRAKQEPSFSFQRDLDRRIFEIGDELDTGNGESRLRKRPGFLLLRWRQANRAEATAGCLHCRYFESDL